MEHEEKLENYYEMLVNKQNPLPKEFIPNRLCDTMSKANNHLDKEHKVLLDLEVFKNWLMLRYVALKAGYDLEIRGSGASQVCSPLWVL